MFHLNELALWLALGLLLAWALLALPQDGERPIGPDWDAVLDEILSKPAID